jgi:hypothetical protein
MAKTLEDAVARFGVDVRAKLNDPSATGEPEDQLRGPLENLIADINALLGKAGEGIKAIGEVRLPDLMTRPDYALTRDGLIGFIEVKAPGKGSDPTAFPAKSADRLQWEKLKSLPNILYTDGNGFTIWRDGKRSPSDAGPPFLDPTIHIGAFLGTVYNRGRLHSASALGYGVPSPRLRGEG